MTEVCKLLRIEDLIKKNPNELSGGERQRVAFASIYIMETNTFVIDEPTSQLDPQGTEEVFKIIKTLKESDRTIILVEHNIDLIAEYCNEILVMEKGRIVFSGSTAEILTNLEILDHGVKLPQTAIFGHEMKTASKALGKIPITLSEAVLLVQARRNQNVH